MYSQGRDSLYIVNHYRRLVGLPPIHNPENRMITWTLKSLHIVDIEDQDQDNDKARAFDFAITRDGKPIWDIKIDTNQTSGPDYDEAGHLWELVGGVWGGDGKIRIGLIANYSGIRPHTSF